MCAAAGLHRGAIAGACTVNLLHICFKTSHACIEPLSNSGTNMTSRCLSSQSFVRQASGRPLQRLTARRGSLVVRAAQVSTNDFKNGMTIEFDGAPYKVVEFLHVKPGKGSAFVRSKLKNFITNNTVDKTWRAGESVDLASVEKKETQFTYAEGDEYVFMDMTTYEETRVPRDEDWAKYLKEGMDAAVLLWNGKVISVELPNTVELEVVETDPGVRGNTASGGSKPAKLETGAVIQVPLFINVGERLKVDTRSDSYLSRASS